MLSKLIKKFIGDELPINFFPYSVSLLLPVCTIVLFYFKSEENFKWAPEK